MKRSTIAIDTLCLIEEIAANEEMDALGPDLADTPESKIWGQIFKLAHNARAPSCRKNHPQWHKEFQALRKDRIYGKTN